MRHLLCAFYACQRGVVRVGGGRGRSSSCSSFSIKAAPPPQLLLRAGINQRPANKARNAASLHSNPQDDQEATVILDDEIRDIQEQLGMCERDIKQIAVTIQSKGEEIQVKIDECEREIDRVEVEIDQVKGKIDTQESVSSSPSSFLTMTTATNTVTEEELMNMNMLKLKAHCKLLGIKEFSKLKKAELQETIRNHVPEQQQQQQPPPDDLPSQEELSTATVAKLMGLILLQKKQSLCDEKQSLRVKLQSLRDEKQSLLDENTRLLDEKARLRVKEQSLRDKELLLIGTSKVAMPFDEERFVPIDFGIKEKFY